MRRNQRDNTLDIGFVQFWFLFLPGLLTSIFIGIFALFFYTPEEAPEDQCRVACKGLESMVLVDICHCRHGPFWTPTPVNPK